MKDDRCKQIMAEIGMPNSRSLMQALFQVANETEQECNKKLSDLKKQIEERIKELKELKMIQYNQFYGAITNIEMRILNKGIFELQRVLDLVNKE